MVIGVWLGATACASFAHAADFYVDPQSGSTSGNGSAAQPWRTLQEVLEANLVETRNWDQLPYDSSSQLVVKNAGAPIEAGDTIWLRSGYHGEVVIVSAYNASTITIAAESGHTPRLKSLNVRSASNWTIRGLSISPEHAPSYDPAQMVFIESHGYSGPSHDVVVEGCELYSVDDASGWSSDDWNSLSCNAIRVTGDDCTIRGNTIRNVNFGISVSGEGALVERNVVDGFAGDGMRGIGDYGTYQYNTIKNCYDVNANHDDGFQSWSNGPNGVGTEEVVGIVLRGNTFINYEDDNQPFRGTLQGIGCFDGTFVDWVVENNVVITDHWHGITLMGARNSRIVNNTVIDRNDTSPGPPWVSITPHKNGTPSEGCLVRNNLTTAISVPDGQDVMVDTNIIVDDLSAHFVDAAAFDLHLLATSEAVDAASDDQAPAIDRDEIPRPQGPAIDVGAYEYYEGTPDYPDAGPDGAAVGGGGVGGTDGTGGTGVAGAGGGAAAPPAPLSAAPGLEGFCGCRAVGGEATDPRPLSLLLLIALGRARRTRQGFRARA
jgi:hypothetical protein